jgi:hypothetical protein
MKQHYTGPDPPSLQFQVLLRATCLSFRHNVGSFAFHRVNVPLDRRLGSQKKNLKLRRRHNGALLHVSSFLYRLEFVSRSFYMRAWLFEAL